MPDFLEKLHTAALRAKNLEVGIHDYTSVTKSSDSNRQPSQERMGGETTHSGPGRIYAWDGYCPESTLACFNLHLSLIEAVQWNFVGTPTS